MDDWILTDSEFREELRRRRLTFPDLACDGPAVLQQVDAEFRAARRKRADIGITNRILNLFLEPRNPFEPQRMRRPKMEAVVFGALLGLTVLAVLAFNLAAPRL